MNLFRCPELRREPIAAPTVIGTPLGAVHLNAIVDGVTITAAVPDESYRLPSGGWVLCWGQRAFDLGLLMCRSSPRRVFSAPPTDCWGSVWRLQAKTDFSSCSFTAVWADRYTWTFGSGNSGEDLCARVWDDSVTEVSIGTEDEEALERRARDARDLPADWEPYFRTRPGGAHWYSIDFLEHPSHEELWDRGMALPLPRLKSGQRCQVHFLIAWSPYTDDGNATHFAVDQTAEEILASAGCT